MRFNVTHSLITTSPPYHYFSLSHD